jgi:hypothetical protein
LELIKFKREAYAPHVTLLKISTAIKTESITTASAALLKMARDCGAKFQLNAPPSSGRSE